MLWMLCPGKSATGAHYCMGGREGPRASMDVIAKKYKENYIGLLWFVICSGK